MRRGGVKSFVDDLVLGRGVVISRAATSLRSVETQPLTRRFVRIRRATISVPGRGESQHFANRQPGESRAGRAFNSDLATITQWSLKSGKDLEKFSKSLPGYRDQGGSGRDHGL